MVNESLKTQRTLDVSYGYLRFYVDERKKGKETGDISTSSGV